MISLDLPVTQDEMPCHRRKPSSDTSRRRRAQPPPHSVKNGPFQGLGPPRLPPAPPPPPVIIKSQGPTIQRLEQLSHLVTTRVSVADVLVGEGEGCRGAWLIRGDALIAVNLGRSRIVERDEEARRAVILLPQPEVLQARVDHDRTRIWEIRRMTWLPWRADQDKLRDVVMAEAQKLVAHAAVSQENIQQAKTVTETIIKAFYDEVGWHVQMRWEETPDAVTSGKYGVGLLVSDRVALSRQGRRLAMPIANAVQAYARLVKLGKTDVAHPSALARYGVAQVRDNRRVGGHLNIRDVMSPYCQRHKNVSVERLDKFDKVELFVGDDPTPAIA